MKQDGYRVNDNIEKSSCLPRFLCKNNKNENNLMNLTIHKVNNENPINKKMKILPYENREILKIEDVKEENNQQFTKMLNKLKKLKMEQRVKDDISNLGFLLKEKFNLNMNVDDYRNYYNIKNADMCNCTGKKQHLFNCVMNKQYNKYIEENIISNDIINYQCFLNIRSRFEANYKPKNVQSIESLKLFKKDSIKSQSKYNKSSSLNEHDRFSDFPKEKDGILNNKLGKQLINEMKNELQINKSNEKTINSKQSNFEFDKTKKEGMKRPNFYKELISRKIKIKPKEELPDFEESIDELDNVN